MGGGWVDGWMGGQMEGWTSNIYVNGRNQEVDVLETNLTTGPLRSQTFQLPMAMSPPIT